MLTFNSERFISTAILSLLTQNFVDFKLYIFDDCSTDRTVDVLKSINDPRVEIHYNTTNFGMVHNFSQAMRKIEDEVRNSYYFLWGQHDDFYDPLYLSQCISFLEGHLDVVAVQFQSGPQGCTSGPHFYQRSDSYRIQKKVFEYRGKNSVLNIHYVNSITQGLIRGEHVFSSYGFTQNIEKQLLISELLLVLSLRRNGTLAILDGEYYKVSGNRSFQIRFPRDSFTLDRASTFKSVIRHLCILRGFAATDIKVTYVEKFIILLNFLHEAERFRGIKKFRRNLLRKSHLNETREHFQKEGSNE
jgi:glycosyltransferase involved in cell wall biosynthesis